MLSMDNALGATRPLKPRSDTPRAVTERSQAYELFRQQLSIEAVTQRTAAEAATPGGMLTKAEAGANLSLRRPEDEVFESSGDKAPAAETAAIVDLVDLVIKSALKSRASDIHIEPTEHNVVVRHRLDGMLKEVMELPKWVHSGFVARLKILGGMDIAEKLLPQDGRVRAQAEDGQEVDFRASTLRTMPPPDSAISRYVAPARRRRISSSRSPA